MCASALGGGGVISESPRHGTEAEREDDDMNGILWKDLSFDNFQQHSEFQTHQKRLHFPMHFWDF